MRFMDFCNEIYRQLDNSGASVFDIKMSNGVSFNIIFDLMIQPPPGIFMFQPLGHIGIYPLFSIVQYYIQLGKIQREIGDGDIVSTILTVIRDDVFKYDRFAGETLIVHLVFKGTVAESFFEIFNWFISIPVPPPSEVKQLAKIRRPCDTVVFIMCRLGIPMWTILQEMIVMRYFIDSQESCENLNKFLNLPLGHYVEEGTLAKCRDYLITLRKQVKPSLDEYLAWIESSPCRIHFLSELGLSHASLGLEFSCLDMDPTNLGGVEMFLNSGFLSDHEAEGIRFGSQSHLIENHHDHVGYGGLDPSMSMQWGEWPSLEFIPDGLLESQML